MRSLEGMTWRCATLLSRLPHVAPTQDNSRRVGGQWPLEDFDGDRVLEVFALIEVITLGVLQVPVEGKVVPLDLSDVFSFTNIDLLQACFHHAPAENEGHIRQGSGGKDTGCLEVQRQLTLHHMHNFVQLILHPVYLALHTLPVDVDLPSRIFGLLSTWGEKCAEVGPLDECAGLMQLVFSWFKCPSGSP